VPSHHPILSKNVKLPKNEVNVVESEADDLSLLDEFLIHGKTRKSLSNE
jgi:hypothetical protein